MLSVGWLVAAVVLTVLLTVWVTFTLTRLDRLHARVDAAQAALDAQLVRRAAALLHVLEVGASRAAGVDTARYERAVAGALGAAGAEREAAENEVGRVIVDLAGHPSDVAPAEAGELYEAGVRVGIARGFYNDAVRDTRTLRSRRMPRILHLAGHRELPQFFDIDDTLTFPEPPTFPEPRTVPEPRTIPEPRTTAEPRTTTATSQEVRP